MKVKALGLALAMAASAVQAEGIKPDRVFVPLASFHANLDARDYGREEWSEFNPGAIFSWRERFLGLNYNAGMFRNSYADWAAYASVSKTWDVGNNIELGVLAGLADYGDNAPLLDDRLDRLVPILGVQATAKNAFVQVQPLSSDEGFGAIVVTGISLDLE